MRTADAAHRPGIARAGVLVLALAGAPAAGEVAVNATIATDYLHRGLDYTLSGPAYQAGVEYRAAPGWFAGTWASRVDVEPFDERRSEVDYYAGYGRRLNPHVAVETVIIGYDYQGSAPYDYDWRELQVTGYLGNHWTVTWAVADNWWASNERSQLLEATLRYPLAGRLTLDATLGRNFTRQAVGIDYSYGQVGLSRAAGPLVLRVGYAMTDEDGRSRFPPFTGQRWIASLTWQL